jgi:methyltransferase (TIGR00027 family)
VTPRTLHDTDRPSVTAQWTALIRALELGRDEVDRIVTDSYAPLFLSGIYGRALPPLLAAGPVVRRAERRDLAGIATSVLCRHRFIDAHLLEALPDVDQVLILGAGYDSRAYRFSRAIGSRPVFEVDLPPLSRRKAAIVAAAPERFGHRTVNRIEIDFRTQTLAGRVSASGFRLGAPTFVVWEGVAMYLTRKAVEETLHALAQLCGPGSVLTMDLWQTPGGRRPADQVRRLAVRGLGLIGEPLTFAISADDAGVLLEDAGFAVIDRATAGRLTDRYATAGRHCDGGLYLLAGRLR